MTVARAYLWSELVTNYKNTCFYAGKNPLN